MKRLLIILSLILFSTFSCAKKEIDKFSSLYNDEKTADTTFSELIDAIKQKDDSTLVLMFSKTAQNETNLSQDAHRLINFISGDITSISSASEAGWATERKKIDGKKKKEVQSSFCVTTTKTKYYIAMKECIIDTFDNNNVGLLSLYIIEANNWHKDSVYRGDGSWQRGINIVD